MLQKVKNMLGLGKPDTDELQREISILRHQQRLMARELNEAQVRNDFKRIQLNHELQSLWEKATELDATERQVRDVAIEEKVDTSRLTQELQQLQADAADSGEVRKRVQALHDHMDDREDALKEDITVIESAIQDTVDEMRRDLIDSFDKEFLALETVLTYEMDAMEARQHWAHDDLGDRIDTVRQSVQEDVADMEADTLALLQANTAALEEQLDTRIEQIQTAQNTLEEEVNARLDELKAQVQDQLDALPVADELGATADDVDTLQEELDTMQDRLTDQQQRVEDARAQVQTRLDETVHRIQEQEIQPLRDTVASLQETLGSRSFTGTGAVQTDIDRLAQREAADVLDLETRLSELEQRLEQELAVSEAMQTARRQEIADTVSDTLEAHEDELTAMEDTVSEHAAEIETLRTGIKKAITMMEDMNDDLTAVQKDLKEKISRMAAADDLDTVQDTVEQLQDDIAEKAAVEDIEAMRNALEAVQEQKADQEELDEQLNAVSNTLETVQDDIAERMEQKADQDAVDQRLEDIREQKADQDTVTGRLADVSQDIDQLRDDIAAVREEKVGHDALAEQAEELSREMEQAQNDMADAYNELGERLTELQETAADVDTVDDLKDQMNALKNAAVRHAEVQEAMTTLRNSLEEVQEQAASTTDMTDLYRRVQDIREHLNKKPKQPAPPKRHQRSWYIQRSEFERLQERVDELSDRVMQLVNKE